MSVIKGSTKALNEITCDEPITRVVISGDEVVTVNPDSAWEINRVYTDYTYMGEPHKELIVVFTPKKNGHEP